MWPPRAMPCCTAPLYSSGVRASARMVSGWEVSTIFLTSALYVISEASTCALNTPGRGCAGPASNRRISADHLIHPPSSTRTFGCPRYFSIQYIRPSSPQLSKGFAYTTTWRSRVMPSAPSFLSNRPISVSTRPLTPALGSLKSCHVAATARGIRKRVRQSIVAAGERRQPIVVEVHDDRLPHDPPPHGAGLVFQHTAGPVHHLEFHREVAVGVARR